MDPTSAHMKNLFSLLFALLFSQLATAQSGAGSSLENTSWQLVEIRDFGNSVFTPEDPEDYIVRFRMENRMQADADCNQAGATWNQEGDVLTLTQFFTTRALCPPPSLFNRFVMHLERVDSFEQSDQRLVLRTPGGGAALVFEPYIFNPLR